MRFNLLSAEKELKYREPNLVTYKVRVSLISEEKLSL